MWTRLSLCIGVYLSEEESQDVLTEIVNVSMLNGLQWISDGDTVMKAQGQTVGFKILYKCPYYKNSQCPFRVRVVKTPQNSVVTTSSVSCLFDIQYIQ